MEVVIIIIICAGFLYLLFGNPTERKFKKGLEALQSNNLDLAEQYFVGVFFNHPQAKIKLDEIIFKRGENAQRSGYLEKAYEYFSMIQHNSIAAEKLIEIDFERGLTAKNQGDINAAYNYFSKISGKSKKAFSEASKIDFKRGVSAELSKNYSLAKEFYLKSASYKEDAKVHYGSVCRKLICDIKSNLLPVEKETSIIINSSVDENLKNDFLYRYSLKLIKNGNYRDASEIIYSELDNSAPETERLITIIENYKKSQLRDIIQEINTLLSNQETNLVAIENIYKRIQSHQDIIEEFPEYSGKFSEVSKNLFGKLLHQYINDRLFEKCLDHILSYPNFYENTELLKNASICCIRIAIENKISESNYKKVIPVWLTAIYNDDIFINSLENTAWDDDYTFTVEDSLGKYSRFLFDVKADNINRDTPSETNISIGTSQRELLNLFEKALNEVQLEKLNNTIYSFYTEEKESVDKLTKTLGYDIPHTTPEFAKQFGIDKTILKYLNYKYEDKNKEEILELGAKYFTLKLNEKCTAVQLQGSTEIEEYASSKWYTDIGIDRVQSKYFSHLKPNVFKDVVNKFSRIKTYFESEVLNLINKYSSENEEDESLINLMENLCQILPDSEKIAYRFSDYTTNFCIDKINAKSITETKALELLVKAIVACPDNHRTAKNLAIFVGMNLSNETFLRKTKELIPLLKEIESESLYDSFTNELLPLKDELKSLMNKPNVSYSKVREVIGVIDDLIESVSS